MLHFRGEFEDLDAILQQPQFKNIRMLKLQVDCNRFMMKSEELRLVQQRDIRADMFYTSARGVNIVFCF